MKDDLYYVVVNEEEQYSIWPSYHEIPAGWLKVRDPAPKEDSLDWINEVWTDMTPRSVREALGRMSE